jgi:hypothetical protein
MYASRIRELCPKHDPRHIEAWLRLQFGTLDHLTPHQFAAEAWIAAECVDEGGVEHSENLAKSYGL